MKKITLILITLVFSQVSAQENNKYNFDGFEEKANSYVNAIANVGEFTGTILVAYKGEVKFHKGYGMASKRFNIPNSTETKFRVGSITKSFTAISILQQVEKGKISLEDLLSKYRKDYPFADQIKIKHLLSHTSGIKRDIKFPDRSKKYQLNELVEMSKVDSLLYTPGTKMTYSNCGYVLLQSILEELTGEDYETYVTKNVLQPLGLKETGIEDPLLPPNNLADGFSSGTDKHGNYTIVESHMLSHGYPDGVGAMYSTTGDMMRFSRLIGNADVLKPETWKIALTPFIAKERGYQWGFGFSIIKGKTVTVYNHNGRTTGFRTGYYQLVEDDMTVIILGNYNNASRQSILFDFQRMLTNKNYYQPSNHEAIGTDELNLDDFAGDYKTEDFPFKISVFKDNIFVQSHGDSPSKMLPYEMDSFFSEQFDLSLKFKRVDGIITGCDWIYKNKISFADKMK